MPLYNASFKDTGSFNVRLSWTTKISPILQSGEDIVPSRFTPLKSITATESADTLSFPTMSETDTMPDNSSDDTSQFWFA